MGMAYEVIEGEGAESTLRVVVASRSKSGKYTLELLLSNEAEILSGFVTGDHGGFRNYINAALKKSLPGKALKKGFKLDAISKATSTTKSLQSLLERSVIKVSRLMKKLKLEPIQELVTEKKTTPPPVARFMGMEYQVLENEIKEPMLRVVVARRSKSEKHTLELLLSKDSEVISGFVTSGGSRLKININTALKQSIIGKQFKKGFKLNTLSKPTATSKRLKYLLEKSVIKVSRLMKKLNLSNKRP